MEKLIVLNFMQKKVEVITKQATFKDATIKMIENKTNGLIVINGKNQVIGILTSWDLIQHLVPDYLEEDRHLAPFEAKDVFVKRIKEVANDPISKFMTSKVITVRPKDSLIEAATLLSEYKIRQLPVVDKGALVGCISRTDIKKAIYKNL